MKTRQMSGFFIDIFVQILVRTENWSTKLTQIASKNRIKMPRKLNVKSWYVPKIGAQKRCRFQQKIGLKCL